MKICMILAFGLIVAAFVSCQETRRQSAAASPNPIKVDEQSVLIPGTAISEGDQEAVNNIFKQYDRSLYRIAVYENGSLKKQVGKMSEMQVGAVASEYSSNAKASGLTNWTMKIGNPTHITTVGSPSHVTTAGNPTHVTTAGRPSHVTTAENTNHVTTVKNTNHVTTTSQDSDSLVKEVTPILEKYSK